MYNQIIEVVAMNLRKSKTVYGLVWKKGKEYENYIIRSLLK